MDGCLYAAEFSDGAIKIGMSIQPRLRLGDHDRNARKHGSFVVRSWYCERHKEYQANEKVLIEWCQRNGTVVSGRETFSGLSYEEVIAYIESLPKSSSMEEDELLEKGRGEALVKAIWSLPRAEGQEFINFERLLLTAVLDLTVMKYEHEITEEEAVEKGAAIVAVLETLRERFPDGIAPQEWVVGLIDHVTAGVPRI